MKVRPLGFDSMGTRSMATLVEGEKVRVLIDGGASLGPKRYGGIPPTKPEYKALEYTLNNIRKEAQKTKICTISHYHFDHYMSGKNESEKFYNDKIILAKNRKEDINHSQQQRGYRFDENTEGIRKELRFADGKTFEHRDLRIKFSQPFFHGKKGSKLGYVLMVSISDRKEKVVHTSDIQGPTTKAEADFIIEENPDLLIAGGPPTYLLGFMFPKSAFEKSKKQMKRVIDNIKTDKIVWDHHLLRDIYYKKKIKDIKQKAREKGKELTTAAGYLGKDNLRLEAWRKEIKNEEREVQNVEKYFNS